MENVPVSISLPLSTEKSVSVVYIIRDAPPDGEDENEKTIRFSAEESFISFFREHKNDAFMLYIYTKAIITNSCSESVLQTESSSNT